MVGGVYELLGERCVWFVVYGSISCWLASISGRQVAEVMPWVPESHAYTETMPAGHRFMAPEMWLDALLNQSWKTWPTSPQAYRQHAQSFSWDSVIPVMDGLVRQAMST